MKAYTDLEQSKKLTMILPIESADMFCLVVGNTPHVHVLTEPLSNYSHWESYPCWSLAALLDALPKDQEVLLKHEDYMYSVKDMNLKCCDYEYRNAKDSSKGNKRRII